MRPNASATPDYCPPPHYVPLAMRRRNQPNPQTSMNHATNAQENLRLAVATELSSVAANTLEPHAGQPINDGTRLALTLAFADAMRAHLPVLVNVRHEQDEIPAT